MKIGYVVKDNTGDYWKIVRAGAMAAGKDLGVEVFLTDRMLKLKLCSRFQ